MTSTEDCTIGHAHALLALPLARLSRLARSLVLTLPILAVLNASAGLDPSVSPTPEVIGISGSVSGTPSGPINTSVGTVYIGVNFTGSTLGQSGFTPPDTMGAVGPNHIVELINGRYAVYDRSGTFQAASSLDDFWTHAGVSYGNFTFDPRVLYDPFSSRWYATAVDNHSGANSILLAVSNSADPTAGWSGIAIDSDSDDSSWADFPMLGLTGDRVTVTANQFPLGPTGLSFSVYSIPKADLIAGNAAAATSFENISQIQTGESAQPVHDLDGGTGIQRLLSSFNKPSGNLKLSNLSGPANAPTLDTALGYLFTTARNNPATIDQPGTAANLTGGDSRFSGNVVQQHIPGRANPSIFAVHAVRGDNHNAIDWYEIDSVTEAILQHSTIEDDTLDFSYPSIAVNDDGDIVIGVSGGSPTDYVGTYAFVGETISGTTTFSEPILLRAGEDDYERIDARDRNRWGDYSATVLDPNDPETFWTFQLFVAADGTDGMNNVWATQITQITVPEPGSGVLVIIGSLCLIARRRAA